MANTSNNPMINQNIYIQAPTVVKSWHEKITPDMRRHLVHKIAQIILPTTTTTEDESNVEAKRKLDLLEYASKTEFEIYEQAKDQEEYFHLLAERIYKIQRELEDKRNARRLQQQQQQQQQCIITPNPQQQQNAFNPQIPQQQQQIRPTVQTQPTITNEQVIAYANRFCQNPTQEEKHKLLVELRNNPALFLRVQAVLNQANQQQQQQRQQANLSRNDNNGFKSLYDPD